MTQPRHTEGATEAERAIRDALAAGPTPGPWFTISRGQYWHEEEADVLHSDGEDLVQAEFVKPVGDVPTTRGQMYMRDAEYIAACNPASITALLAELDSLRSRAALSGWQPIETAPKDGTHILVSWPMRQMDDEDMPTGPITRRDTLVTWMNGDSWIEPDYLGASGAWFGDEDCYAADPDLWMPLPTPPAPNQGAES